MPGTILRRLCVCDDGVAALLTSNSISWRLIVKTFHGQGRKPGRAL